MLIRGGFSKKIGQPDYGSLGAEVTFEIEVEPPAGDDKAAEATLDARTVELITLAEGIVSRELARRDQRAGTDRPERPPPKPEPEPEPERSPPPPAEPISNRTLEELRVMAKTGFLKHLEKEAPEVPDFINGMKWCQAQAAADNEWTQETTDGMKDWLASQIAGRISENFRMFSLLLVREGVLLDEHMDAFITPAYEKSKDATNQRALV